MRRIMVSFVAVLAISGCGAGAAAPRPDARASGRPPGTSAQASGTPPATDARATATPGPTATVAGAGCEGSPVLQGEGFPEVKGVGEGVELWGLLFAETPLRHGAEIKIVWRMTGDGPLREVRATLPDGTRAKLAWGPEEHGGSSWHRPGQEWGTGFVFPRRGCWKVELTRDRGRGHAWLRVR
ncbi:hypothetical protein MF672_049660 [Actinomadura sp. ATCC 31491]|uniref:DUF2914 domain-containing protein n=1 Tax=Actinomadura luzonensis TaxID=2805427 RepID=A0ABT0GBQ7_9ACTN|nr:hypothetical protein [Actinomadura luzonensis]MCK2221823.1 hypothetical protein [Actinomadura luzonensis]